MSILKTFELIKSTGADKNLKFFLIKHVFLADQLTTTPIHTH